MIKQRQNFTKCHHRCFVFLLIINLHITMYRVLRSPNPIFPYVSNFAHRGSTVRRIFQELNQPERRGFAVFSVPEGTVIAVFL
jgi:hypothetical protein